MDALNTYGLVFGICLAVLSAAFSFFNRERYKTLIRDIYQPGNDELRNQLATTRTEKQEAERSATEWRTKSEEKDILIAELKKLNAKQADFTSLTAIISNNHKEVVSKLTDLAGTLVNKNVNR